VIHPSVCAKSHFGIADCANCGLTAEEQMDFPVVIPERYMTMTWDAQQIAKYSRLTDNSENAVAIRALACKAYKNYMPDYEWDEVNPMVRDHWCAVTAALLAVMGK